MLVFQPRNKMFAAASVNKDACHQWLRASSVTWWAPRELRKERIPAISSQQTAATPRGEPWTTQDVETQDPGPRGWGTRRRTVSASQALASFYTWKSTKLKSLNLDYLVSFNLQENFWHWRLPALCCKASIQPGSDLRLLRVTRVLPQGPSPEISTR